MSSGSVGCVYSSQPAMGIVIENIQNGDKYTVVLDNNYDIMLYNVNQNEVTFYTNTNQVTIYGTNYYMLIILNPEPASSSTISSVPSYDWFPNAPPSNFSGYQFVIKAGGSWAGKDSYGFQVFNYGDGYTSIFFDCSIQTTYYFGNGSSTTPILTSQLTSVSNLIQTLAKYYYAQLGISSQPINELTSQNEICGTLIGEPDSIVFTPSSVSSASTTSSSTSTITLDPSSIASSLSTDSTASSIQSSLSTGSTASSSSSSTSIKSLTGQLFNSYQSSSIPPLPPQPTPINNMNKELNTLITIIALALIGAVISLSLCRSRKSRL